MTNPIQDALDLLDGGKKWHKGHLAVDARGNAAIRGQEEKFCAVGALRMAMFGRTIPNSDAERAQEDVVRDMVAEIAAEQYPERAKATMFRWPKITPFPGDPVVPEAYEVNSIPAFNDDHATEWADVELVLEKGALKWAEIHG